MGFDTLTDSFAGRPVVDLDSPTWLADIKKRFVPRFRLDYNDTRDMVEWLREFAARSEAATTSALVFGAWSDEMYEVSPRQVLDALIALADRLPALRHLFVGDLLYVESMTSVTTQSDYGPLLAAFGRLETLKVRGTQELAFGSRFRHPALRSLTVEDGGLPEAIIDAVAWADLPNLEHLELWLGGEVFGGISTMRPVERLLASLDRFPRLRYLGLRNSEDADAMARAVAGTNLPPSVHILDLSMGTLSDEGGEALLASAAIRRLERLDLHFHYLSAEMEQRLHGLGIAVDVSDRQAADVSESGGVTHIHRYNAVSE